MPTYNYDHFRSSLFDFTAFSGPRRGDPMPDAVLQTLGAESRKLSDYRGRTLVIETGSVTCPMYAKGVGGMAELAARHPEVAFVVLYVREAHPGERIGPHADTDAKRAAARLVEPTLGDRREVLIDDLEGTTHRMLGGFPNMVYIVDQRGSVVFRGDWVDVDTVSAVLDGSATDALLNTQHYPPTKPGPRTAIRTLLMGGYRALFEFIVGLPGLIRMHHRADRHYSRTAQPAFEPS